VAQGVEGKPAVVHCGDAQSGLLFGAEASTAVRPDGTFEFRNLVPGSYKLQTAVGSLIGSAVVNVGNSDVEGVSIPIRPFTEIAGRYRIEGEWAGRIGDTRLSFETPDEWFTARPTDDGTFSTNLPPGRYTVLLKVSSGESLYLKSARFGSIDVLTEGLTVGDSGRLQLDAVFSTEAGQITGTVVDADGKPVSGATAALVPETRLREQVGRFQSAAADQNGHFDLKGMAPGEYKVFAWEDVEPGMWFDTEFLKKYEAGAEPVTVQARQQSSVKVQAK
jgi:hypothetical protein